MNICQVKLDKSFSLVLLIKRFSNMQKQILGFYYKIIQTFIIYIKMKTII